VSGPAAIEAALAIAGPSLDELQGGRVALAVLRLDLSGELDIPGVHARAQNFGADVDVAFSLVRDGNLLSRYVVVSPPMPRAPQAIGIELEGPLPGGGFLGRSLGVPTGGRSASTSASRSSRGSHRSRPGRRSRSSPSLLPNSGHPSSSRSVSPS
jgi:hypothetical protein